MTWLDRDIDGSRERDRGIEQNSFCISTVILILINYQGTASSLLRQRWQSSLNSTQYISDSVTSSSYRVGDFILLCYWDDIYGMNASNLLLDVFVVISIDVKRNFCVLLFYFYIFVVTTSADDPIVIFSNCLLILQKVTFLNFTFVVFTNI